MRPISENTAIGRLREIRHRLRSAVAVYERRAKSCISCETRGACCLDAHFVNVHISRLEAAAIARTIAKLPPDQKARVMKRTEAAIDSYRLAEGGDTYDRTFACPLFEQGFGCLVHTGAKPVPCIVHACYESKGDLPPEELQEATEEKIDDLNTRTYGRRLPLLPLPVALRRSALFAAAKDITHNET
jgi:hypothetical protein